MKKIMPIIISAIISFIIVFIFPLAFELMSGSSIKQDVIEVLDKPSLTANVYDGEKLIGTLQSVRVLNDKLNEIYQDKYAEKFPNSFLSLGGDLYVVEEMSYSVFEDKDEEILNYIIEKDDFFIETNAIEFSNADGVFAVLYVESVEEYEEALKTYMLNFISEDAMYLIMNNQTTPELSTFGTRDTSFKIYQNITVKRAYADPDDVKTDSNEILEYLKYGEGVEKEYYTVVPYDMVDGVATKVGRGLTAQQIVNINKDVLQSVDQVLVPGTELNITYFVSPIDVEVMKEKIVQEEIFITEPLLIEDESMYQGESEIMQESEPGYENVMYKETWINGYLVKGEKVSSVVTTQPKQEIIRVGSKDIPSRGTGTFRIPIDNPTVTCGWGCYPGHRAVDLQNAYERYGNIYASDRGVVEVSSFQKVNGYYMVIDHGNNYKTYYGHMNKMPFFEAGDIVNKGEIIGQLGMTGRATGPHVHFFITYNGEKKDPCDGFISC
ncbi:MAG: peptidoglycan DD-metalloendopeptidase family protein [Anaerorhabdus sp.]